MRQLLDNLELGRLFRRMGLPFWTFLGIGISGMIVAYIGLSLEVVVTDLLWRLGLSAGWAEGLAPFIVLGLALAVVITLALWQRRRGARKRRFPYDPLPMPEGKLGLILLVSRADSALYAIEYHYRTKGTLRHAWLIPSSEDECEHFGACSREVAVAIEAGCAQLRADVEAATGERRPLEVQIMGGASPADAQDTFDAVNRVYRTEGRRRGLEPADIVADFTGGTKPMAVGMIMACLPYERSLEYVPFNPQEKTMSGPFTIDYQHSAFDLVG